MEFNFDNETNITTTKTPSVKVLNEEAKLWNSYECAEICEWKLDCIPQDNKTEKGNIIYNPRILILQRSSLLKVKSKAGRIVKVKIRKMRRKPAYLIFS